MYNMDGRAQQELLEYMSVRAMECTVHTRTKRNAQYKYKDTTEQQLSIIFMSLLPCTYNEQLRRNLSCNWVSRKSAFYVCSVAFIQNSPCISSLLTLWPVNMPVAISYILYKKNAYLYKTRNIYVKTPYVKIC